MLCLNILHCCTLQCNWIRGGSQWIHVVLSKSHQTWNLFPLNCSIFIWSCRAILPPGHHLLHLVLSNYGGQRLPLTSIILGRIYCLSSSPLQFTPLFKPVLVLMFQILERVSLMEQQTDLINSFFLPWVCNLQFFTESLSGRFSQNYHFHYYSCICPSILGWVRLKKQDSWIDASSILWKKIINLVTPSLLIWHMWHGWFIHGRRTWVWRKWVWKQIPRVERQREDGYGGREAFRRWVVVE